MNTLRRMHAESPVLFHLNWLLAAGLGLVYLASCLGVAASFRAARLANYDSRADCSLLLWRVGRTERSTHAPPDHADFLPVRRSGRGDRRSLAQTATPSQSRPGQCVARASGLSHPGGVLWTGHATSRGRRRHLGPRLSAGLLALAAAELSVIASQMRLTPGGGTNTLPAQHSVQDVCRLPARARCRRPQT